MPLKNADMPPEPLGERWEAIPINLYGEFPLNLKTTPANTSSVDVIGDDEGEFVDPAIFRQLGVGLSCKLFLNPNHHQVQEVE
jgi:hypothetical protein